MSAEPAATDPGATLVELVDFGVALRSLGNRELDALHRELMLTARTEPSSAATLRLAILLGYRGSPDYDLDRAIDLLNQIARTRRDEDPALHTFAKLMAATLIDRRSLAVDRDSLAAARDADAERIATDAEQIELLQSRLEEARASLAAERERSQRLQNQLDALIELEEQLSIDEAQADGGDSGQ